MFNVLRLSTVQESLRWLVDMSAETVARVTKMRSQLAGFEERIANTLLDFATFQSESGKSSNMSVQEIFARQLRAVRGLGIDNCAAITKVFKTPFLLHMCYQ